MLYNNTRYFTTTNVFVSTKVPFLSVGGGLGWREEINRGVSQLSGEYCVENVKGEDGELYRRLVFLSNSSLVQSESRLLSSNASKSFFLSFFEFCLSLLHYMSPHSYCAYIFCFTNYLPVKTGLYKPISL